VPESQPTPPDEYSTRREILRRAGPFLGIGSTFLAAVGLCTFGGWWLDGKLGTAPWLTVAGDLVGVGLGFYLFIKVVMESRENGGSAGGGGAGAGGPG